VTPGNLHGKEGVDGSSPSEGSEKAAQIAAFSVESNLHDSSLRWVWSRLWSYLRSVLHHGNERAREIAKDTLATVRQLMNMKY
jgi:hypothetical protein